MKLIVTGATGFVATEIIRQSLRLSQITEVVAIARKTVPTPPNLYPNSDASKLRSVSVKNYSDYPDDVRKEFGDADACIWTVAIKPSLGMGDFAELKRVCQDYTMAGLKAIQESRKDSQKPFRYLYMSGSENERDQTKKPWFMPEYSKMRGETETMVLNYAKEHGIEVSIARPGGITDSFLKNMMGPVIKATLKIPYVHITECAAAMLDKVVNGSTLELIENHHLVEIGKRVLKEQSAAA